MSTITLYKDKVNGVGSLIDDIIKSSNNLNTQLGTLRNTIQGVSSSTCDLQSTVDSISSSSKSEKEKVEDLKKLNKKLTEFIELTDKRDEAARDAINKSKKDFYSKYKHLKPESEKSLLEHIVDDVQALGEWCKEHWKFVATLVMVVAAIAVLCIPGVGPILTAACIGCITGALWGGISGGVAGGIASVANGGNFWTGKNGEGGFFSGAEDGAFSGAITGAVSGALGAPGVTMKFGTEMAINAATNAGVSILGDLGDNFIKGDNKSFGEMFTKAGISAGFSVLGDLAGEFLGKFADKFEIKIDGVNSGKGSWQGAFNTRITCRHNYGWSISPDTFVKGIAGHFIDDFGIGTITGFIGDCINSHIELNESLKRNVIEENIKYNRFSVDVSIDIPDINVNPMPAM